MSSNQLTQILIIVESPAKCKKIEEYLGKGYKCIATYGHLRELISLKSIDILNNFKPTYSIIDNKIKKTQLQKIKKEILKSSEVIIACDNDREGEKICFCICEIFKLDIKYTKRITFNEITQTAIQYAIQNPSIIDLNLVNAQQARQILDLLVGFKVSSILYKFLSTKDNKDNNIIFSAGRCQTPALKLIYDNQLEINKNTNTKVYNTTGYFTNNNLIFELNKQYQTESEMNDFLYKSKNFQHIYTCSNPVKIIKKNPIPFTTCRLQQVASNELHYSPKETMDICQSLYENGFITYMRTDSIKYSSEFIDSVTKYILQFYNCENYINTNIKEMNNLTNIKEAHEAIRPTNIFLSELTHSNNNKERKMYKLIWENTLESCMAESSFNSITATILAAENTEFTYNSLQNDFPGWQIVSKKYLNEIHSNKDYYYLQLLKQNSIIVYKKIISNLSIINSKQHITEAYLVNLLEKKGIGRPSTFAYIIDKIQERGYVKKKDILGTEIICNNFELLENGDINEITLNKIFGNEKNKLIIQPTGITVIEFLNKYFNYLFNYNYTYIMEEQLDSISKGDFIWYKLCEKCNNEIDVLISNLITRFQDETEVVEISETDIKQINQPDNIEMIDTNKTKNIIGQYNGKDVILKKGKFGLYLMCGTISKTLKKLGNRPIENITFDEIKPYLEEGDNLIRKITSSLSIRKSVKGDYLFYKTVKMKTPKFYDINIFILETGEDYKICDIVILKSWIFDKYKI
jgi:DNA topoisomerase-1